MSARSGFTQQSRVHEGLFSARSQDVLSALSARSQQPQNNYPLSHTHVQSQQPAQYANAQSVDYASVPKGYVDNASITNDVHGQYGLDGGEESDPLQLEHMIGYAGEYRRTVLGMPGDDSVFIKR